MAARKLGLTEVPTILLDHLNETQRKAYILADNRIAINSTWDNEMLSLELMDIKDDVSLAMLGFSVDELDALLNPTQLTDGLTDEDAVPEVPIEPTTKLGDIYQLGNHRLMCGDSTSVDDVSKLMNGKIAQLLHADPPYGMGKEGDGVANDNLYDDKLDAFQMEWWATFRTFIADNASAYIWGNAPDLWRLWYRGGLADSERLTFRNCITWNKYVGNVKPTVIEMMRSYCKYREDCLFFAVGEQGFNNNADNYWEGFEPIRLYLDGERKRSGLTTAECNKVCGKQNMTQSAFTKGGFRLILKEDYNALKEASKGKAFDREYDDLKREFYSTRFYFDNTHENMTEVWEYEGVKGEERHGHATPKPVDMMVRVMRSSLPKDGICVEPFGGSGSTLMGAELSDRTCYTMELQGKYVDVIVKRWQNYTGKDAMHEATGKKFSELKQ
jgi:DNA modification methylase